jgi:AraC family transcriptional regulator, transcriptional activator of pobA
LSGRSYATRAAGQWTLAAKTWMKRRTDDAISAAMTSGVPTFYLYGEPRRSVDERFVHVEALIDRTRPSEWTIRPHAHPELNHIFHVQSGGGSMRADAALLPFAAPCLLLVPAGAVHGFQWSRESSGSVVTLASSYFADFARRDPDLAAVFARPSVVAGEATEIGARIAGLAQELGWAAPGHRAAVDAGLLDLLVQTLRLIGPDPHWVTEPGPQASLVARLRERIEERYRLREPIEAHAAALGVTPRRLRAACAAVARQSPGDMLDQRTLLEAKRSLLYGNLSVAEVGYALGFADPAYFSRFFSRRAGVAPMDFRRGTRTETRSSDSHLSPAGSSPDDRSGSSPARNPAARRGRA